MLDGSRSALLALSTLVMMVLPETPGADAAEHMVGGLPRRADWGMSLAARDDGAGAEVRRVAPGSVAARAGLAVGDRVARIEGQPLDGEAAVERALRLHRAGARVRLDVARGARRFAVTLVLPALPVETIPGVEVTYGAARSPRRYRVRTVVTRPHQAAGKLPAILFVPWLSCDPVEAPGSDDGMNRMLQGVAARGGWVVMRVEKPGCGDSEGPDCAGNDLETDLDAYRAALAELRALEFVDPSRIVLFGASLGGSLAALLAAEQPVAGVIAFGTFGRTWFEHMLEIERARLTLSGRPPAEVNDALRGFAEFYSLYLGERRTPGEVLRLRPHLAPLWYDAPDGQYGRPAAFYHQVAALNPERAWAALEVPVLVLYGEYDWIMSPAEHHRIAAIVNAQHPGRATLVELPRTSHGLKVYASAEDAFHGRDGRHDDTAVKRIVEWLRVAVPAGAAVGGR